MLRHVPNALTTLRLLLAGVFFAMLSWYQYEGRGDPTLLNVAFAVYLVALLTDFLDGYLARRWQVEGAFGRVLDPFVDKILVLGSFMFFAGKNFVIPEGVVTDAGRAMVLKTITGVTPVMVVILLGRELLVTSLRGLAESSGQHFGAALSGKLKMVFQSITILVILAYVNYLAFWERRGWITEATYARDAFIYATLLITVWSGVLYVQRGVALYGKSARGAAPPAAPSHTPPSTSSSPSAPPSPGVGSLKGQRV